MLSRGGAGQRPRDTALLRLGQWLGRAHHECRSADRIRVDLLKQDGYREFVPLNVTMLMKLP
jgi:hypothetical protein